MKKTAGLFCALLITLALNAQKKQSPFFTELGVGPSFPIGDFAKKTYNGTDKNLPGFANAGLGFTLSAGYHINESVGLLLLGGYSINQQDEEAYEQYIKSNVSNSNSIAVDAKSWKIAKVMAGGFFVTSLTSSSDLVLRTKLTAGACKTAVPQLEYVVTGQGSGLLWRNYVHQAKLSLPWSFCYQVSIGLKYKLNKKLYALFNISSLMQRLKKNTT
jgi:hypothetical protein